MNRSEEKMPRRFLWILPFAVFTAFAFKFLYRNLWFDEAMTLLNFAMVNPVRDIYFFYPVPNNHILHTFLLRGWLELQPEGIGITFFLRLFPFLTGLGVLAALLFLFRRRTRRPSLLLAATALSGSLPFLIYATSLHGYVLSASGASLTLAFGLRYIESRVRHYFVLYALAAMFTTGIIPSNLIVIAACVLYILPVLGRDFYRKPQFWYLTIAPNIMFLLFYLPIWRQFMGVCALGEGWDSPWAVLRAVLAAVCVTFGVLLIAGLASVKHRPSFRLVRGGVWILPLVFLFLTPKAPFPRVIFPFFPLFTLLVAGGLDDFFAVMRKRGVSTRHIFLILCVFVLISGGVMQQSSVRAYLSRCFGGGIWRDDFFNCYYLSDNHTPAQTVMQIKKISGDRPVNLYMSISADPWPIVFYGQMNGLRCESYRFDGPLQGKVEQLVPGTWVILRTDENAATTSSRFGCELKHVFDQGFHSVYLAE